MPRNPPTPPTTTAPVRTRIVGWLHCKVCSRAWQYTGFDDPTTWPLHRCLRNVAPMSELLPSDPNHRALFVEEMRAEYEAGALDKRWAVNLD